ncbi:class I SAM-dependent methyltransferase [Bacillaceae bacterium]
MAGHRFNPENAHKLDNPERRKLLPPEKILQDFRIDRFDVVLDLGAGTGYFALPAARMTEKKVIALDVEPRMLEMLKEKAEREQAANVHLLQGEIENIPLEEETVDKIIASFILHETGELAKTLRESERVLKPGGRMLVIEWERKPMEEGPPFKDRLAAEDLQKAIGEAGMNIEKTIRENGKHYLLYVKKQ